MRTIYLQRLACLCLAISSWTRAAQDTTTARNVMDVLHGSQMGLAIQQLVPHLYDRITASSNSKEQWTILAPLDAAIMMDLNHEYLQPRWSLHVQAIFQFHILGGDESPAVLRWDDFNDGMVLNPSSHEITQGSLAVSVDEYGQVSLSELSSLSSDAAAGHIIISDLEAENGVVHQLDRVLMPPCMTHNLWQVIHGIEGGVGAIRGGHSISKWIELIVQGGMEHLLSNPDQRLTLLVPTDSAVAQLPQALLDEWQADLSSLQRTLLYHTLSDIYPATLLESPESETSKTTVVATMLQSNSVVVEHQKDANPGNSSNNNGDLGTSSFLIESTPVVEPDAALASNGLIWVMESVLAPTLPTSNEHDSEKTSPDSLSILSAQTSMPTPSPTPSPSSAPVDEASLTLWDVSQARYDLSVFVAIARAWSLYELLEQPDTAVDGVTVFAPVNTAFVGFSYLFKKPYTLHMQALLAYHIIPHPWSSSDLEKGGGQTDGDHTLKTLDGATISLHATGDTSPATITISGDAFSDVQVVEVDVSAANGVLHVVDGLFLPPFMGQTLHSRVLTDSTLSTLLELVTTAGIESSLTASDRTLLAPTNEAFVALPAETMDLLRSNIPALTNVLEYHILPGVYPSFLVRDGLALETAFAGHTVSFHVEGDVSQVNHATVQSVDILVRNGIVHTLDSVLLPPSAKAYNLRDKKDNPTKRSNKLRKRGTS